jgi:hypothetical protein
MAGDLAGDITRHFDGMAVMAVINSLRKFGDRRIQPAIR